MVTQWLSQPEGNVSTAAEDARVIALHVLFAAGFGVKQDFHSGVRVPAPGHELSHRDALMKVMDNLVLCVMVPKEGLLGKICSLFPLVQQVLSAMNEFRQYTDEAMAAERRLLSKSSNDQKQHLMRTLLRTSDAAQEQGIKASGRLTDDEIRGNMFIFYFAGHDTTASTLTYAFALLAAYPEIQRWVDEEIDEVLGRSETPEYGATHLRLKRVLAVMVSLFPCCTCTHLPLSQTLPHHLNHHTAELTRPPSTKPYAYTALYPRSHAAPPPPRHL